MACICVIMEGYIDTDKERRMRYCQGNVTLWMLWHDGAEQKCEGHGANKNNELCRGNVCITDGYGCELGWTGDFGKQ